MLELDALLLETTELALNFKFSGKNTNNFSDLVPLLSSSRRKTLSFCFKDNLSPIPLFTLLTTLPRTRFLLIANIEMDIADQELVIAETKALFPACTIRSTQSEILIVVCSAEVIK